ncbi:unnamed protein product [Parnassius apollo]|uniref:(apollo) hypothetical protein n=1 Tax=Parnassius apollo TaxID=110799 RepID=A0A8S3WZ52_PARAO|nr:unnamed protein product [Parnassius apollo]
MYFKERKKDKSSQEYQNDINLAKTVSVVTGLSERTIRRIVSERNTMDDTAGPFKFKSPRKILFPAKRIEVDSFTLGVIRRKVSQF